MVKSYPEYSYDLADELIEAMAPYRADGVVALVKEKSLAGPDPEVFREAGERAASAAVEAGKTYRDRTGEMIDLVAAKTGLAFPTVMQRYLEIWLLCTGLAEKWQLKQATLRGIVYEVAQCAVRERAGQEWPLTGTAACGRYCEGALETMVAKLGLDLGVEREDLDGQQGLCRFTITPRQCSF